MLVLFFKKEYCTYSEVTKTKTPKTLFHRSTIYPPQHIFLMARSTWPLIVISIIAFYLIICYNFYDSLPRPILGGPNDYPHCHARGVGVVQSRVDGAGQTDSAVRQTVRASLTVRTTITPPPSRGSRAGDLLFIHFFAMHYTPPSDFTMIAAQ